MKYIIKLFSWLVLGTIFNLVAILVCKTDKNKVLWWQLGLYIIAWIIIEFVYIYLTKFGRKLKYV